MSDIEEEMKLIKENLNIWLERHTKLVYNTAIEHAAKVAIENMEGCCWPVDDEIRKLKK